MPSYGEQIHTLRVAKGLTQVEVAKILDKSLSAYKLYENDINQPNIETLKTLSSIFGVSVDFIIGNLPEPLHTLTLAEKEMVLKMLEASFAAMEKEMLAKLLMARKAAIQDLLSKPE